MGSSSKDESASDVNALAAGDSADSADDFRAPSSRTRDAAPIDYAALEDDDDDPLAALEAMYENEKQARKQAEAEVEVKAEPEDSQDSQDEEVKSEVKQEVSEDEVKQEEEEDMEDDYKENLKEEPKDDDEDECPLASRSKYKEDSEDEEYEPETKPKKGR